MDKSGDSLVKRRLPVRTALVGLLVAPAALAQQGPPQQPADPPKPDPSPQPPTKHACPAERRARHHADRDRHRLAAERRFRAAGAPSLQRVGSDIMDVPQSVIVINKALMQSQGATSLTSAVRNVPGITIGAAEGGQIGNNINLNGFSARTDLYHRRHARPRPVLSRHLRPRADRGADGPVVDAVRPRLDRRRDQPGAARSRR